MEDRAGLGACWRGASASWATYWVSAPCRTASPHHRAACSPQRAGRCPGATQLTWRALAWGEPHLWPDSQLGLSSCLSLLWRSLIWIKLALPLQQVPLSDFPVWAVRTMPVKRGILRRSIHRRSLNDELLNPGEDQLGELPSSRSGHHLNNVLSLPETLRKRSSCMVDNLELGAPLGRGSYGKVYKGEAPHRNLC